MYLTHYWANRFGLISSLEVFFMGGYTVRLLPIYHRYSWIGSLPSVQACLIECSVLQRNYDNSRSIEHTVGLEIVIEL